MACLFFFALFSVAQTDSSAPVQPKQQFPVSLWWLLAELGSHLGSGCFRESKATWKRMVFFVFYWRRTAFSPVLAALGNSEQS